MKVLKCDLERLRSEVLAEQDLIEIGRARLKAENKWYPADDLYPDELIKVAKRTPDKIIEWATGKRFLAYGAIFQKHLALHHYPRGEDRIGFRYPPRG